MSPRKATGPATASTVNASPDSEHTGKPLDPSLAPTGHRPPSRASARTVLVSAIARNTGQCTIDAERFPSLAGQGPISIDCETFDPDLRTRGPGPHRDGYIAGIAVGTEAGYRGYFPIAHEAGPNLPKAAVLSWLSRELQSAVPKIGANLIYD